MLFRSAINGTTLPKSSEFWISYYPPNGWRCRCIVVLVLASKYPATDVDKATAAAEKATTQIGKNGKNKLEMFRFNPGLEKRVFPKGNSYEKVVGADKIIKAVKEPIIPEGLLEIEKKFDYEVPRELLSKLKENNFKITNNDRDDTYYTNYGQKKINIQSSYLNGKYGEYTKKNVLVHELGHAIDNQMGLAERPEIKKVMDKYREKFSANKNKFYKGATNTLKRIVKENKDINIRRQSSDFADIVKALNNNYGFGHTTEYYNANLKPEKEFLAHCFQLRYNGTGNKVMLDFVPELHNDMVNLIDVLLKD